MNTFKGITEAEAESFRASYGGSPLCRAMTNALYKTGVNDVSFRPAARQGAQFAFSLEVPTMAVTNQQKSGRCWIFSALNFLRERVAKKCNIEMFELSQNYIAFWDKLEKANYFLESVMSAADRPADDRLLSYILSTGISDGGQWDMFVNLVAKYGVVPKAAMEETFQSSNTGEMNRLVNTKLRQCAARFRSAAAKGEDLRALKERMLDELYRILCMCFGEPPRTFDFEYVDKDKKFHADRGLTPKTFYDKYVGLDLRNDYVSLTNSPTRDKPFYRTYTIDYLGNVADGSPVHYLNVPMDELKELILAQLKGGEPVWFGSDVGHSGDREKGIWSTECYDFAGSFGMDFSMTKEERLDLRESAMNHAMLITGADLDEAGVPVRWKIENSWSDAHGDKGYYLMSADWFDNYVYQAVVAKKYLDAKMLAALDTEPLHFFPWDPMGTLAD